MLQPADSSVHLGCASVEAATGFCFAYYYTSLDILHFAIEDGHLTPTECDAFLTLVKKRNSKPGFDTYQQYLAAGPRSR